MPRMTKSQTQQRDAIEDELSRLGSALVYLHLVRARIDVAIVTGRQAGILSPALDDLSQVALLLRSVQRSLAQRAPAPTSPARSIHSEYSSGENHDIHKIPVPAPPGRARRQKSGLNED